MYGKQIFSWNVPAIYNGNPEKFVDLLKDGGFEAVALKAGDGNRIHTLGSASGYPSWGENVRQELVDALRAAGIRVYLWHFLYGGDPKGELAVAVSQCQRFKPDGYIWDVEGAFDIKIAAESNARLISRGLKAACPNTRQTLCWWALPKSPVSGTEWHPIRVAKAWLETVDSAMPMDYWQGSSAADAMSYLNKSLTIWRTITDKPLVPAGRAYDGDGGNATPDGIRAFANSVKNSAHDLNLVGTSWWSLDKAIQNPAVWAALKATPTFAAPITALTVDEILTRLMGSHRELFPEIYGD